MSTKRAEETDFIISIGSAKSLKDRKKHTDPDCQYIQDSNTREYRPESDPEMDVCKRCGGTLAEDRKDPSYAHYRLALRLAEDLNDD